MKTKKRHISTKKTLIICLIVVITLFASLLYLYHSQWKALYFVDNVPTSLVGVGIIIILSITTCTLFILAGFLFTVCFPYQSESEKRIKNLPNDFTTVDIKDFENFPLSKFISREDISCSAKLDEDGKITYSLTIQSNSYQTDDYELFLKHFDV